MEDKNILLLTIIAENCIICVTLEKVADIFGFTHNAMSTVLFGNTPLYPAHLKKTLWFDTNIINLLEAF